MRRASGCADANDVQSRFPFAVPRGREVCGGARVGVDVLRALRPCVGRVVAVQPEAPSPCAYTEGAFGECLVGMRSHISVLAEALGERFGLPTLAVATALAGMCPGWAAADHEYSAVCLAGRRTGRQGEYLSALQSSAFDLHPRLRSVGQLAQALIPVLVAAGCGFRA